MTALSLIVALCGGASVELTAERLVHDDARKLTTAEGDADLVATNARLSADRITWDEAAGAATASGNVTLRMTNKGLLAVIADVVTVRMNGDEVDEAFIYDGVALRKKNVTPDALMAARTPDQVRSAGNTVMSMNATHLVKNDDDTWTIDELAFTPCECNFDKPSWHIGTSRTTLDLEAERASLLFPTIWVWKIPVLWFPWLSLPLSDRQTGLLVPKPGFTALNGFSLEQPVFVTLGRSADLTFTPGYFFGGNPNNPYGIEGPRLHTEFRYTPSPGTTGRATLGLIIDRRWARDPVNPALLPEPLKRRGLRAEGSWVHLQDLGKGFHDRVNLSFLSDGYLQRDSTPDVLARDLGYLRSTATIFHRGEDHFAGLDAVMRQDLSTGDTIFANRPGSPNPVQRLPGFTFAIPALQLAGPLFASGRADFARLGPVSNREGSLTPYDRVDLMPRLEAGGV
ncbi:MAG: LPS-assembly protein LptD, partial [Myxococcaceae bacterium]|nr:LPS-assembly protein LptD [Myxococcaceae bacterium]